MMKRCGKITTILIIISILFVVFCQTVVYSSFNSIFDITGTAYARMATDVRITDFKISEKYTSNNFIGAYEKFSKNTVSTSITFFFKFFSIFKRVYKSPQKREKDGYRVYYKNNKRYRQAYFLSLSPDYLFFAGL